jgi:hypothetical protein
VEGSEEYFDESEHVDGLAKEEVEKTRERGRGREREGPKTHVGWPEEPQLRGALMVRFRKSSNARRIAGMSQCVGYGVISRMRTREKMAAVRRGVTLRRRRVVVGCRGPEGSDLAAEEGCEEGGPDAEEGTRRYGMRCRKPCQRWGVKSMTRPPRPFFAQGLKRRDPLQQHHPKRQCGLRMCLVIYTFLCQCVQLRLYVRRRIFNCNIGGLR